MSALADPADGGIDSDSGADSDSDGDSDGDGDNDGDADSDGDPDCVVFVDLDVASPGDGTSWAQAFDDVQQGIDAASMLATAGSPCQVWVAQGVYYVWKNDDTNVVKLAANVELYGGFSGTETSLEQRDWDANVTVLNGRDGPGENHFVHFVLKAGDGSLIDGFTVNRGQPANDYDFSYFTTAMLVDGVETRVSNSTFTDCKSSSWGGAIRVENGGTLEVDDSSFVSNHGVGGGGAIGVLDSTLSVTQCDFTSNSGSSVTYGWGGAIALSKSSATIEDSQFDDNVSRNGGAVSSNQSSLEVSHCSFSGNSGEYGGALSLLHGDPAVVFESGFEANTATVGGAIHSSDNQLGIDTCSFVANSADIQGGAIDFATSDLVISDCEFSGNSTEGNGGALAMYKAEGDFDRSRFISNSGPFGGALYFYESSPNFENCVFASNSASTIDNSGGFGGFLYNWHSTTRLTNCTIHGNTADEWGGAIDYSGLAVPALTNCIVWNNEPEQFVYQPTNELSVVFSDVQGGWVGSGNIDSEPLFLDPAESDFRLHTGSPCIDAANGSSAPETDMNGDPRVDDPETPDTGTGDPTYADMGAYEFQP